jgi:SWI/SNF-related matrix-associated actin-dependent regulator 1 of chromatin subfamily A
MALSLKKIEEAYNKLKEYNGENPYIIKLKNIIIAYQTRAMNDFESEYVLSNFDREPKEINKMVMISDWYGEKLKENLEIEFVPKKLKVTWYLGETDTHYHFYCIYRKSQDKAVELFAPKKGILTNFLMEDYHDVEFNPTPYEEKSGFKLYEHQIDTIKFLLSREKGIVSLDMGMGKTISAIVAALEGKYEHILVISPSSVKKTWENELRNFVNENEFTVVQGSKWDDAKFTIINYDILDNFYTIPEQTVKSSELNVDGDGNVIREYKDKKIVSRSKKIIDEAMSKSQLFQSHYDLIIIDEAHRLSNNTSGRFKIISDLIKRSNPKGIFELTGTMITNGANNLKNLLKLIDLPITRDWQYFMERYCGAKFFYKKNERNAYTAMFLKDKKKATWYDLSQDEKKELDEILEKKCKKLCIPGEDTNMEELKEIIKPYYLRRTKEEINDMVKKTIKCLHYEMTDEEQKSYDELWDKYLKLQEDKEKTEKNKKLIEVSLMRQWLADKMIPKTVSLVKKCVELGHKVLIFCAFDNEINKFVEEFGDICVYHNGKLNEKKKNEAVEKFQNDDNVKVFIGNIFSAGVGLTLTAGTVCVFNNFSFVPADNLQCQDRIHRLNQTKPCTVYYQSFNGTYFDKMLEIVHKKEEVIDKIIVTEREK